MPRQPNAPTHRQTRRYGRLATLPLTLSPPPNAPARSAYPWVAEGKHRVARLVKGARDQQRRACAARHAEDGERAISTIGKNQIAAQRDLSTPVEYR